MTPNFKSSQSTEISEQDDTEAKVRRALGLGSAAPSTGHSTQAARSGERFTTDRPKSRFVQDGDVPVVMIRRDNGQHATDAHQATGRSPAIRLEAADKALKAERHARETAERSLAEAQAMIRDLQTKLGHAILVRDEARANAERAELEKHAAEQTLATELAARQTAEQTALSVAATQRPLAVAATAKAAPKTTPRPRSTKAEPKPVKWWIKSK